MNTSLSWTKSLNYFCDYMYMFIWQPSDNYMGPPHMIVHVSLVKYGTNRLPYEFKVLFFMSFQLNMQNQSNQDVVSGCDIMCEACNEIFLHWGTFETHQCCQSIGMWHYILWHYYVHVCIWRYWCKFATIGIHFYMLFMFVDHFQ